MSYIVSGFSRASLPPNDMHHRAIFRRRPTMMAGFRPGAADDEKKMSATARSSERERDWPRDARPGHHLFHIDASQISRPLSPSRCKMPMRVSRPVERYFAQARELMPRLSPCRSRCSGFRASLMPAFHAGRCGRRSTIPDDAGRYIASPPHCRLFPRFRRHFDAAEERAV